ncbi:MAG: glycoside hydrolase family 3 C-terminal domain-containing protein [Melioribacteraceae bacterium]|nr:glycoside hydrolase family 3 C-terminal domain-containing protein [Melioribacteraceae bacterium]
MNFNYRSNHYSIFYESFNPKIFFLLFILVSINMTILYAEEQQSINQKVENILTNLTLDEKLSMLHGNSKFTIAGVERLGIPEWKMSDGPHGVREEINRNDWEPAGWNNDYSTYLPTATALGATWNKDLAYQFGIVLGKEARARNKDVILGPGVNIHRTPLCGRNFEYLSEDPILSATLAVPYIIGVQEQDVAACVKHYALNNQEYERNNINVIVDERTLREIYLPSFEAAIKNGKALTIMSAYNKVNGKWCSENPVLLNDILKKEWNFEGVVISDWAGTHSTIDAALAGLDIEMGTEVDDYNDYFFGDKLKSAIENGEIEISVIDEKVRRILTTMFKTNVFDKNRSKGEFISENNFALAKRTGEEAVVLLKNNNNLLPLNISKIKKIAVIGENAIIKHAAGGGSSGLKAKYEISPLEGLKTKMGDKVEILFTEGYKTTTTFDWQEGVIDTSAEDANYKREMISEAVQIAKNSEVVIMFIGLNHHFDLESRDRTDMFLPYGQDELIKKVLEVNNNIIVVNISGSPIDMRLWVDEVPAILQGWYAGSEAGNVFADILFGDVNPSGKLPFTFPKKLEDSPAHKIGEYPGKDLTVNYNEGIYVGYRYFDTFDVTPQFSFGYGLSYTDFGYKSISLNNTRLAKDDELEISVFIENIGRMKGSEVVQLYIEDIQASVDRPRKELKDFSKVELDVGEIKEVSFRVDKKMLSFFDTDSKSWKAEPGKFKLHIGSASDDIRLTAEFELVTAENIN